MIFRDDTLKLRLVGVFTMPERVYNAEKKKWEKTGNDQQMYEYTFQNVEKELLVLVSSKDFTEMENQDVEVSFSLDNDPFNKGQYKVRLIDVSLLA